MNVLAYHPFLIKPNNHELGEIFHETITEKDDVVKYAKKDVYKRQRLPGAGRLRGEVSVSEALNLSPSKRRP